MERTIYMTYLHDNRLTNTVQVFKSIAKLSYFSFCHLVNTPDFVRKNITKGYSEYICEFKIKEDIEFYIVLQLPKNNHKGVLPTRITSGINLQV